MQNHKLQTINLSNMRLIEPALCRIIKSLKFALSLKSILLSGNSDLTDDKLMRLQSFIGASIGVEPKIIRVYRN